MRKPKTFLSAVFAFVLVMQTAAAGLVLPAGTVSAEEAPYSLGTVIDQWEKDIAPGVEQETVTLASNRGRQEAFVMNVDLDEDELGIDVGLPNGKDLGMQPVRQQAAAVSKPGQVVIGAFNGDFYNTSTGIPNGTVIHDGRILKSGYKESFGVKKDGTPIFGIPGVQFKLHDDGATHHIAQLNGARGTNHLALYAAPLKSTGTNTSGTEAVLSVVSGDVHKPGKMKAVVEELIDGKGNQAIENGNLILSGHGTGREIVKSLKPGQEVEIETQISPQWLDAEEGLSGNYKLIQKGQKVNLPSDNFTTAVAPRTAVGMNAEGEIFFVVIDGRAPGYSEGITVFELRDMMAELGAVEALNLDGGGSSTFAARQPGEEGLSIVNRPSDGFERSVANSFLITTSAEPGALSQLAMQPDRLLMLKGSREDLDAKGMDAGYFPKPLNGEPDWSVSDSSLGTVDEEGLFTAGNTPGKGTVRAGKDGASGTAAITVTDKLTEIKLPQDALTLKKGDEINLAPKALLDGKNVDADPSLFEWKIEGGVGSIDQNGQFKASSKTASGKITVSHGGISDSMTIQVGKLPIILEDFEKNFSNWTFSGARYNSISIKQTTYPEPARFGSHALQLNYDFTGTTGTSGAYAHPKQPIQVEDYPESIGMWVYGDGNNHWLRAQMRDANNSPFALDFASKMNWTGWKYVEAKIPAGKALPLKMDLPVRLMETSDANKDAGTIYVDNIRAVYGDTNDDLVNPVIDTAQPADGTKTEDAQPVISAIAKDEDTGINPERIAMKVDGKAVQPAYDSKTGTISYQPEAPMLDGFHKAELNVQDNFGNEADKSWTFETEAGQAGFKADPPKSAYIGSAFPVKLEVKKAEQLDTLKVKMKTSLQADENKVKLSESITSDMVLKNKISEDGTIELELKGLNKLDGDLVIGSLPLSIPVTAKGKASVEFLSGSLKKAGTSEETMLFLPNIEKDVKAHFTVEADRASVGFPSKLTVKDENGNAVEGAEVSVLSPDYKLAKVKTKMAQIRKDPRVESELTAPVSKKVQLLVLKEENGWIQVKTGDIEGWIEASDTEISDWTLGETNEDGTLKTSLLTLIPGKAVIQASKEDRYSFTKDISVLNHLGTSKPERLNVTFNGKTGSRNVTWTTSPLIKDSVVQIAKKEDYEKDGFSGRRFLGKNAKSAPLSMDAGELQVHTAEIMGLVPGQTYMYRVGDGTPEGWSEPAEIFAKDMVKSPFTFLLMGDTQAPPNQTESGFGIYTELFKKAKTEHPDAAFMMHVGDMIDDGNLYSHWNAFFESMKDPMLAPSTAIMPTVGNHENIGSGVQTFKSLFNMPGNGPDGFEGTVYSYDYGDAHFAVLNTETDTAGLQKQAEWLIKDMAKSKKKWKIVTYHRSPYYSNPQGGAEAVKSVFPKAFDEAGIDLAISGHDHAYVRTHKLKEGKQAQEGTTYLIAGSTGGKFYDAVPQDYMDVYFEEKTQIYSSVTVSEEGIKIVAKARDGRVIDEHLIKK
ncbi:phosphodiester glycosidase family protein [Metabacillus sp. 113a]|uniref:phosphodiester glycosidase family protein n=1 Tax=Metabacillus sp. 113a TaxID=3404706 RepID=UPI003CEEBF45